MNTELQALNAVTPHSLLGRAITNTLNEYAEYYLLNMKELYTTLVYIRVQVEPAFISDEKQLINIYNVLRESVDPVSRKQSSVPMRFLTTIMNRWFTYISNELDSDISGFVDGEARTLATIFTIQDKLHVRLNDVVGDTLTYENWVSWLKECPIFILIFTMKHIDSDYLQQTQEFVLLYEKNKDNAEYIKEA